MKVTRLAGALGAEVTGIDLSCVKTKEDAKILENLLNQYAVIFFPKQNLSIEEHIHLGTLQRLS